MVPISQLSAEQKQDIKKRLEAAFGPRLAGVVLYGSMARGDAEPDSDIDVLVLLKGGIKLGRDLTTIIDALYPLELTLWRPFHGMPVDEDSFNDRSKGCYAQAREEGIAL
jgi:uncharacterized protein